MLKGCSGSKFSFRPSFPSDGNVPPFQGERLNVLLIVCDDMNRRLSCYGDPISVTPNIDRLALSGILFRNAHNQYPLCNPSRTSLLSGYYPMTTRVWNNLDSLRPLFPDLSFLPHHFRTNGYWTARVGKVFHHGQDDPASWNYAFPAYRSVDEADDRRQTSWSPYEGSIGFLRWQAVDVDEWQLSDGRLTRMAADLIKNHLKERPGQPFFISVGIVRPHLPWIAPRKYFDLYDLFSMPLPSTLRLIPTGPPKQVLHYYPEVQDLTDEQAKIATRAYYACLSFADTLIGFLLDTLEEQKISDKTIIVLTSDNGYHLGEHGGFWEKRTLFEESTAVPLILSAPHVPIYGVQCLRPVELVDLYPTLCELCALPQPAHRLHGRSLVPLLLNPRSSWNKPALTMFNWTPYTGYSIRTERWRYTLWEGNDRVLELYDHDSDPAETTNLAYDSRYASIVKDLDALLSVRRAHGSVP
ncbi:MAG: sulfatase [Armatimonadota bacterium]|nr:sulfatase [Armatimonadota bacterium]